MECSSEATSEPRVCAPERNSLEASYTELGFRISGFHQDLGVDRNPEGAWGCLDGALTLNPGNTQCD